MRRYNRINPIYDTPEINRVSLVRKGNLLRARAERRDGDNTLPEDFF